MMVGIGRSHFGRQAMVAGLVVATGCSAKAQSSCTYDLYIYQPARGASIYAVAGGGGAAAMEVAGCNDVRLLPDPRAAVARLEQVRAGGNVNLVTVEGPSSRTEIGGCSPRHFEEERDKSRDNMVIVTGASAVQMRRTIETIGAAPRAVRQQMIADSGLGMCVAGRR